MSITISTATAVAKQLAEKEALKMATQYFKDHLIGRWSEYRANRFFDALLDEIRKEKDVRFESADLNDMLRAMSNSDKKTTALFDAYRRVALSASKDIGPMIIGMLTANIVLEDREATPDEELIFQGAETLNDHDFLGLTSWLARRQSDKHDLEQNGMVIEFGSMEISTDRVSPSTTAPKIHYDMPDLADMGIFLLKLKNLGLLSEKIARREDPRMLGRTHYHIVVSKACMQLERLAARAISATV
ncbi:hypothetical protein KDX27_12355 [Burkholderia cenocepacia]|jgi:hypothetical protein|nr:MULTISPECIES: hypothetical protein [Burkholderia]MDP9546510.1 hypothetical protein [Burkholderia cepacia]AMU16030.1 hypothetical protein A3203_24435 [Burkholderia cenocepacia]MBG0872664.1 hypothetical protein [Burkholderia sp. 9777_1386]MBR7906895.1 hypothetical protein [Burkholderia cenocepacia]MBR8026709.1 hypothetical protein [Burkholderia cenocepacia]